MFFRFLIIECASWGTVNFLWYREGHLQSMRCIVLRSKGLKDAMCVGWFGDDWDCSVGFPPEAMGHMSSAVPVGYAV